jgi:cellulose synthase operon protein C
MAQQPVPEDKAANWTPRIRRISTPDVAEQGKLAFIRALIGEKRFDEAEVELRGLLAANPRSFRANLMMGRVLERKREHTRAVEHFEAARAADPTRAEPALMAGKAYLHLKNIPRAGEAFQVALDLDPRTAGAHFGLAQVHFLADELEQAETHLRKALDFDPQLKPARALLARVHSRWGDYDSTRQELEAIVATRPDQRRATLALARIHMRQHRPNEAIGLLHTVLKYHESDVEALTLLGRAKLAIEDPVGAEESLRRAIALDPRSPQVALLLVDALASEGKAQEATAVLDRLPEAARRRGRVQAAYGDVYAATEHYKQAAEAYRAVLLGSKKGEALVATIEEEASRDKLDDAKTMTERYQAALKQLRSTAPDDGGERRDRRRVQRKRQRLGPNAGKAHA